MQSMNPTSNKPQLLTSEEIQELKVDHDDFLKSIRTSLAEKGITLPELNALDCDDTLIDIDVKPQSPIKGSEWLLLILQFASLMGIPQVITTHRMEELDHGLDSNGYVSTSDITAFFESHGIPVQAIFRRNDILPTAFSPAHLQSQYDPVAVLVSGAKNEKLYQQEQAARLMGPKNPLTRAQITIVDDSESVIEQAREKGFHAIKVPHNTLFRDSKKSDYLYLEYLAKKVGLHTYAESVHKNPKAHENDPPAIKRLAKRYNEFYAYFKNTVLSDLKSLEPDSCVMSRLQFEGDTQIFVHPGLNTLFEDAASDPERAQETLDAYYQAKLRQCRVNSQASEKQASDRVREVSDQLARVIMPIVEELNVDVDMICAIDEAREKSDKETRQDIIREREKAIRNPGKIILILSAYLSREQEIRDVNSLSEALEALAEKLSAHPRITEAQCDAIRVLAQKFMQLQPQPVVKLSEEEVQAQAKNEMAKLFSIRKEGQSLLVRAIEHKQFDLARKLLSDYDYSPVQVSNREDLGEIGALATLLRVRPTATYEEVCNTVIALAKRIDAFINAGNDISRVLAHLNHKVTDDQTVYDYLKGNPALQMAFFMNFEAFKGIDSLFDDAKTDPSQAKETLEAFYESQLNMNRKNRVANPKQAALQQVQALVNFRLNGESLLLNAIRNKHSKLACLLLTKYKASPAQPGLMNALLATNDRSIIVPVLAAMAKRLSECAQAHQSLGNEWNHKEVFDALAVYPEYLLVYLGNLQLAQNPQLSNQLPYELNQFVSEATPEPSANASLLSIGAEKEVKISQRLSVLAVVMAQGDHLDLSVMENLARAAKPKSRASSPRGSRRGMSEERSASPIARALQSVSDFTSKASPEAQIKSPRNAKPVELLSAQSHPVKLQINRLRIFADLLRQYQDYRQPMSRRECKVIVDTLIRMVNEIKNLDQAHDRNYQTQLASLLENLKVLQSKTTQKVIASSHPGLPKPVLSGVTVRARAKTVTDFPHVLLSDAESDQAEPALSSVVNSDAEAGSTDRPSSPIQSAPGESSLFGKRQGRKAGKERRMRRTRSSDHVQSPEKPSGEHREPEVTNGASITRPGSPPG